LLSQPDRLSAEADRRLRVAQAGAATQERSTLQGHARKRRTASGRLIAAYTEGLIAKGEVEPRISRVKARLAQAQEQLRQIAAAVAQQQALTLLISRLATLAATVPQRLEAVAWPTPRTRIRPRVKRVAIDREEVPLVFRINPEALPAPPTDGSLHYGWRREYCALGAPAQRSVIAPCLQVAGLEQRRDQAQEAIVV
jgi:site-specific DNA recombinase